MTAAAVGSGARFPLGSNARIVHAVAMAFIKGVLLFGVGFGALGAILGDDAFSPRPRTFLALLGVDAIDLGLVIGVGVLWFGRVSWREVGWSEAHLGRDLGLGLLGAAACVAGLLAVTTAAGIPLGKEVGEIAGWTPLERLLWAGIGVGAALGEETLFRGYLHPAAVLRFGRVGGIFFTAVVFDLYHLNFRPLSLLSKLWFGLVFGVLRERTGGLVAPAVAHALFWVVVGMA